MPDVVVVVELVVLPVPDVVLELGDVLDELLGDELEPLGELPDVPPVPEVPAPEVVSVEVEPETEPDVLGVVLPGVVTVVDVLLLSGVVVVVVLGVVVVVVEEVLGVEPELPLLPLLQPVAATEARAMTATRGIRRFMTSPIRFTYVEERVWLGVVRGRVATGVPPRPREQRGLHARPVPRASPGQTRGSGRSSVDFVAT